MSYTQLDGVLAGIRLGERITQSVDKALVPVTAQQPVQRTVWREDPNSQSWEKRGQKVDLGVVKVPPWVKND